MTTEAPLRTVLVGADPRSLAELRSLLADPADPGLEAVLERAAPFAEMGAEEIRRILSMGAPVVLLDLRQDPGGGIGFARRLLEAGAAPNLVALIGSPDPQILLEAMRTGIHEILPDPVVAGDLREAAVRVRRRERAPRAPERAEEAGGRVVSVLGVRGGSGSTTISTNLAVILAQTDREGVLLMDLDLELGETALQLRAHPRHGVLDLVRNLHRADAGLLGSLVEVHESGVHLLAAPVQPTAVEGIPGDRIDGLLRFLRRHYRHVVVDTPKSLSPASFAALRGSDLIVLVANADLPSLRNLTRLLPLLKGNGTAPPPVRIVLNRWSRNDPVSLDDVERTVGLPVFATIRNDYRTVSDSIHAGVPAVSQGRSAFAVDLAELAARLDGSPVPGSPRAPSRIAGILGRLAPRTPPRTAARTGSNPS